MPWAEAACFCGVMVMWRYVVIGCCGLGLPATAQAEDVSLSFGATIASEYVSSGIRYTDGIVAQPFVEVGFGAFYAGAYASNLNRGLPGARTEYGLSAGYRGALDRFSYDVGVAYYAYDEVSGLVPVEDYAETYASGTFAVTDRVFATASAAIAPEFDQTNLSLRADHDTALEGLSVGAEFGRFDASFGTWNYWSVDTSYAVSESLSLGLAYHDTDVDPALGLFATDGLFVASLSLAFSLR